MVHGPSVIKRNHSFSVDFVVDFTFSDKLISLSLYNTRFWGIVQCHLVLWSYNIFSDTGT